MFISSHTKNTSINRYYPHHIISYINNPISTAPPLFTLTSASESPITNNITICIVNHIKNTSTTAYHPHHIIRHTNNHVLTPATLFAPISITASPIANNITIRKSIHIKKHINNFISDLCFGPHFFLRFSVCMYAHPLVQYL